MKKFLLPATAVFLSFIFSCNFEAPEKVSVVTDATYSFTVGEFKKSLSEYMSVEKIQEYVSKSDSGGVKYAVYDYNPPSNNQPNKRPMQKYLVDMTLAEIPVDVGAYLEKMDFSDLNSKGEGISLGQKIAIPNLSEKIETTTINFPDISKKFENETIKIYDNLPIPEVDIAPGSARVIDTTIKKPDFKTATLYSGGIVLDVIMTDGTPTPGFSTDFTFELLSEDGKLLSRRDNVDIVSGGEGIRFDLGTKTITKNLKLKIYGTVFGGTPSTVNKYTLNAKFSPGTKFSKITGFTDEIGDSGDVEQYVTISTDETFVECEIASGSLEIVSKKPDGWTGVAAKLSDSESISGALELPETAKFNSVEDSTAFIRKKMDLAQSVFTKKNDPSGKIIFKDRISFSCRDATLVFPNGEQPQVTLETACRIQKASYVVLDLSSKADMLNFQKKIPFSGGMEDYVEEMTLVNSGLEISYKNTLPKGNDGDNTISMEIVSGLLEIKDTGEKKKIMLPQKSETFTSCSPEGQDIPVSPKTDSLDFDVKLILPRYEGKENWAVLKNVDLDGEYEISVSAKPVFDWRSVKIKTPEGSEIKGEEDTELSFDKLFSTMKDELGDESEFIDNIKLVELPLYLYFQKPKLDSLSGMGFTGNIALKTSAEENASLVSGKEIEPKDSEIIKTDKDGVVVSELSEKDSSGYADIASLFNSSKSENLKLDYDVRLGGLDRTVEITKAEYEQLKSENKDAPVSIKISARLVIPLALSLDAPDADGNVTKVNILKLAKKDPGEDLFDRGEATSLEDVEKYIDLIESASLIYNIDNGLFSYGQSSKSGDILFVTNLAGVKRPSYKLSMESGKEEIYTEDVKAMLRTYPFKPGIVASFPDGILQISRNAEFKVNLAVKIHTHGKLTIFGD